MQALLKLALTLSLLATFAHAWVPSCVSSKYPLGLGEKDAGSSSITQYDVVDVDSKSNLAVGGFTTSATLCPGGPAQHPIVEFLSSQGTFTWYKCINTGATSVSTFYSTVSVA